MGAKKSTKSLRKFIQTQDKFGHPIGMNWNGGGGTFNTTIGGIVSTIIFILKLSYFGLKLKNFFLKEGTAIG